MSSNKTIKGKRPQFYETPGVDYLMHMIMVLSQELSATKDRLDTLERVANEKALFSSEDIEHYVPTQDALEHREEGRQKLLSSLFSVMAQEAAEVASGDSRERFNEVIKETAKDA